MRQRLGHKVFPPRGWTVLLQQNPAVLPLAATARAMARAPRQTYGAGLGLLGDVNRHINETVRYEPDAPGDDRWGVTKWVSRILSAGVVLAGDCEDFALLKAKTLIAHGVSAGALRLVTCWANGIGHCVLAVDSEDATHILDNRAQAVLLGTATPKYRWVASSDQGYWWRRIATT